MASLAPVEVPHVGMRGQIMDGNPTATRAKTFRWHEIN